jgi:hypothetical protein
VRDKEYLNWRYVDVPDVDYTIYLAEEGEEICGYIVLRCVNEEGLASNKSNSLFTFEGCKIL